MHRMKIMAGHQRVMPYIMVRNAENFIDFIRKIFQGEEIMRTLDSDQKIEHSEIRVGDSMLLVSEAISTLRPKPGSLYIYVKDADQTYHEALEAGSRSIMQPMEEDYGARTAGFEDPFGTTWWITTLN